HRSLAMNLGILAYCRAGFESDCAAEWQDKAAKRGVYGYCQTNANQGYVWFRCQADEADHIARKLKLTELVFTRQFIALLSEPLVLPENDRLSVVLAPLQDGELNELLPFGDVRVEMPDTNDGKEWSKFARKFTVPLRKGLREHGWLTEQESQKRSCLHLFMLPEQQAVLGYSYSYNQSPWLMGIPRLRMPSRAPSRSTLKLAEAFQVFIPAHEKEQRL